MRTRKIGALEVPALGLGCMAMSEFYGPSDEATSLATIDRARELGVSFLDTADAYGIGANEELVGRAVRGRRADFVIATKFGFVRDPQDPTARGVSGRPEYVRAACEASLRRLGIEQIDLYYQHRVDPNVPIEETVGAMAQLVRAGKVRFLGLSEAAPETIRRAHRTHPITAVQTELSLWTRDAEQEVLPLCRELGIGFVAYSPLGRGMLTGQLRRVEELAADDFRRRSPRFQGDNFQRNLALVDEVGALARTRGVTPAQLALAWVLSRGDHVVAIPGTRHVRRLEENAAAADLQLTPAELEALDRVAPRGRAIGDRYDARGMSIING